MLTLAALAQAIGGRLAGPDSRFTAVSTDTRTLPPGALFVAIRGERFDGHEYAQAALEAGAAAVMVDETSTLGARSTDMPLVVVPDTKQGLARFASWWRANYVIPVVAIVGSNGKTTVKEMTAAILRAQFGEKRVLATAGNLNNDIGLPLTLLRLTDTHEVAVVELGMNHPGETAMLAAIAQPTIGLINNAQREHQEFMKSVADVATEHAALLSALPAYGAAIINADDAFAGYWRNIAGMRPIRDFGQRTEAMVTGRHQLTASGTELEIVLPEGVASATLRIPGAHNVQNALAAAAAASAAGAMPEAIGAGLSAFRPAKGRLQVFTTPGGATLIDDSYNANPDSVRAAIDVLAARDGWRILVLGDMGEVGDEGPAFHVEVGRYARERGIDSVLATGPQTAETVRAFGSGAEHFAAFDALLARCTALALTNTTLLVKGSRFMRMERVVSALYEGETACSSN
jgi:UDP-N-acetylmuramoyl-tripeptide--D-alanyl-D-alanine ligase